MRIRRSALKPREFDFETEAERLRAIAEQVEGMATS